MSRFLFSVHTEVNILTVNILTVDILTVDILTVDILTIDILTIDILTVDISKVDILTQHRGFRQVSPNRPKTSWDRFYETLFRPKIFGQTFIHV
jgi:hypothetical protein